MHATPPGRRLPVSVVISMALAILIMCSATAAPSSDEAAGDTPIVIGRRKQLFVDDYVVAVRSDVTRELGTATKANDGKPIFTGGDFYGTVAYDQGRFKMWWRKPYVAPDAAGEGGGSGYGYAESAEGLHFQEIANVVGLGATNTASFYIDPHETAAARRYKACYGLVEGPYRTRAALAYSADGIHWTAYAKGEPVTYRAADTYNQIIWDDDAQTYRMYTRTDFGAGGGPGEVRGTRGMVNPDINADPKNWRTVRHWAFDRDGLTESNRRQIYALTDWIYCGVHFALMSVYEWPDKAQGQPPPRPVDKFHRHEHDIMNFYLGTSRDGNSWDLSWVYACQPIIPRGADGTFDKDIVFPSSSIITHDDKHWIYYFGGDERHWAPERTDAIGLATLRLDGFVCLAAGDSSGLVITKPFLLQGSTLEVNIDAHDGDAEVELQDAAGRPIPGYSGSDAALLSRSDQLRWQPDWKDHRNLGMLEGRIVRLKLSLTRAKLYAFQVK